MTIPSWPCILISPTAIYVLRDGEWVRDHEMPKEARHLGPLMTVWPKALHDACVAWLLRP